MINTNVGTACCWTGAVFGFKDFGGDFWTDFGVDFVDFVPDGFTGILAGGFTIGRAEEAFEIGRIGFWGVGLVGFVGGDLVDFGDFVGPVGVDALWRAIPVLAPWLWFRDWNLTELPSISVRHFAVQLKGNERVTYLYDKVYPNWNKTADRTLTPTIFLNGKPTIFPFYLFDSNKIYDRRQQESYL